MKLTKGTGSMHDWSLIFLGRYGKVNNIQEGRRGGGVRVREGGVFIFPQNTELILKGEHSKRCTQREGRGKGKKANRVV